MSDDLKDLIFKLDKKLDDNRDMILKRLDEHKENVCTPTRIKFSKDIEGMKIKQSFLSGMFGTAGGLVAVGLKYLLKK